MDDINKINQNIMDTLFIFGFCALTGGILIMANNLCDIGRTPLFWIGLGTIIVSAVICLPLLIHFSSKKEKDIKKKIDEADVDFETDFIVEDIDNE